MFVAREISAAELDLVPSGSIVFRMNPKSPMGGPEPMRKWSFDNTWAVLGENAEVQTAAMVSHDPHSRFVLMWEGEADDDSGDRWREYMASTGPW